jgi:hypothetical protein
MIWCNLIIGNHVEFDVRMPTKLASRKEQDIMKSLIHWAHFIDMSKATMSFIKDDVTWIQILIAFSRNNCSYLSVGCTRKIVMTAVTCTVKAKENPAILIRQICCSFNCLLVL